jgi:hypothetical protein
MSETPNTFNKTATYRDAAKKKRPAPFSLRLTFEERAQLEREAAGMSLGAYIRAKLFDNTKPTRQTRGKFPVKDHKALGKVLGLLGQTRIANNLNQLAKAANRGLLQIEGDTEADLREACRMISHIRDELVMALGLREGSRQ